jgi:hypothetical protein
MASLLKRLPSFSRRTSTPSASSSTEDQEQLVSYVGTLDDQEVRSILLKLVVNQEVVRDAVRQHQKESSGKPSRPSISGRHSMNKKRRAEDELERPGERNSVDELGRPVEQQRLASRTSTEHEATSTNDDKAGRDEQTVVPVVEGQSGLVTVSTDGSPANEETSQQQETEPDAQTLKKVAEVERV